MNGLVSRKLLILVANAAAAQTLNNKICSPFKHQAFRPSSDLRATRGIRSQAVDFLVCMQIITTHLCWKRAVGVSVTVSKSQLRRNLTWHDIFSDTFENPDVWQPRCHMTFVCMCVCKKSFSHNVVIRVESETSADLSPSDSAQVHTLIRMWLGPQTWSRCVQTGPLLIWSLRTDANSRSKQDPTGFIVNLVESLVENRIRSIQNLVYWTSPSPDSVSTG